jgi:ketosteroid isomerase-like protein
VSEQNLDVVRRVYDAFVERDVEKLIAICHADIEFLPVTANLTTGGVPYRGHDGLRRYFDDLVHVWDDVRLRPDEMIDRGDTVIVLGRVHARGGGMVIDRPTGWVWRLRDGKIWHGRVFGSHAEASEEGTT